MASPEGESFYCITLQALSYKEGKIYAYGSIATAFLGFLGSLIQMIAWRPSCKRRIDLPTPENNILQRSSSIIFYLALSDYFACVLVIVKSVALLLIERPIVPEGERPKNFTYHPADPTYRQWGLPLEYLERFFYVCTYLWTFSYAIDVLMKLMGREPKEKLYHLIWLISALLTGVSIFLIVYKRVGICTVCERLQLSYITSYWVPLALVFIGNPILYAVSGRLVDRHLKSRGIFSNEQRRIVDATRFKFVATIGVFYFCWWTSFLVLGVSIKESCQEKKFHGTVLIISAFFNPLQGLLNLFIYGKNDCFRRLAQYSPIREGTGRRNTRTLSGSTSALGSAAFRKSGSLRPDSPDSGNELIDSGSYDFLDDTLEKSVEEDRLM